MTGPWQVKDLWSFMVSGLVRWRASKHELDYFCFSPEALINDGNQAIELNHA